MSTKSSHQPDWANPTAGLRTIIEPSARDIGAFEVRRALPSEAQRRVGPFVFFDEMGPATLAPGAAMDVRPHPHIGLSTLTWLFAGEIMHRDSLGFVQPIRPGEVNWMTAGRGIVHSERTPEEQRGQALPMHGIQVWIALPDGQEEVEPDFQHYPADAIPRLSDKGVDLKLIAGEAWDMSSPVQVHSPLFYAQADLAAGSSLELPAGHAEQAIYIVSGEIGVGGERYKPGRMLCLDAPSRSFEAAADSRVILLGGEPLGSDRTVYWNFVASSKARIEQAKDDWRNGRFDRVPGDDEFIPLPDDA
jgi:redox-sensitive bicupin YhaK (pirin superfamily)